MKKFDTLVNSVYSKILLEQEQQAIPQNGGPVQPGAPTDQLPQAQAAAPAEEPPPAEEPAPAEPLSSEGKVFLVDLIRKALAISPDSLSPDEKAVFSKPTVQATNADEILEELERIITDHQ